jgi:hypothetical protein
MFIPAPPVTPIQSSPAIVAVFQAANCTLDKALGYDLSLISDEKKQSVSMKRKSTRYGHARFQRRGNLYNGAVNPSEKTIPIGLHKSASNR